MSGRVKTLLMLLTALSLFAAACGGGNDPAGVPETVESNAVTAPDDPAASVDGVVSTGECFSEIIGLAITAPEGWQCRVLEQADAGMDGLALFTDGNGLNVLIATPSGLPHPCEVLGGCDDVLTVVLSDNFPDTVSFELSGTITITGTHKNVSAELVITKPSALTDAEIDLLGTLLDSTREL